MDGETHAANSSHRAVRTPTLVLLALGLLFLMGSWNLRERVLVLVAVPVIIWLVVRVRNSNLEMPSYNALIVLGVSLLLYDTILPRIVPHAEVIYSSHAHVLATNAAWLLMGAIIVIKRRSLGQIMPVLMIGVAAVTGSLLILNTPEPPLDVWELHRQAGDALVSGENPYADLYVESSFTADSDSDVMVGYSYTPPNLVGFGLTSALTTDSRWFSLACWLVFLTCLSILGTGRPYRDALIWLVASQPAWPLVLEMSYTEPLTISLLGISAVVWRRHPLLAAGLLGVALASKQYLAVLVPILLITSLLSIRQRMTMAATGAVSASIGLIWGAAAYWDAVVSFHGRVPPQTSSINLYAISEIFGFGVSVPTLVGAALAVALGLWLGRDVDSFSDLTLVAALTLTVTFFLASQAFVNYWLLVACLLCMAFAWHSTKVRPEVADRDQSPTSA